MFDRKHWKNITDDVKDLLKKMLDKNPKKRLSAGEILYHPWFKLVF